MLLTLPIHIGKETVNIDISLPIYSEKLDMSLNHVEHVFVCVFCIFTSASVL